MFLSPALHNQLEICSCHMSRLIHKQESAPTKFIEDFEKSLARTFTAEWVSLAEKAVESGMRSYRGKGTEAEANKIISAVNQTMGRFGSDDLVSTVTTEIEIFYEEVTTRFIEDFGLSKTEKAEATNIGVSFTQRDRQAIEATQRMTAQSAGRYFPDQVSGKVSEVVRRVVLESGLSAEEAAVRLQAELEGALGIKEAASTVPTQFAANPEAYFRILASNASVQATSVGRIITMADSGVTRYRIQAVRDSRTSNICRTLDGKEFEVAKTMQAVESFLAVNTLNDLEQLMPFNRKDEVPDWANDGLGFPPYHMSCRTTVVPTGF